ncbi:MAG: heavy metal translocating P-type ATPase [Candidatus Bathyarchaeia archaeon]
MAHSNEESCSLCATEVFEERHPLWEKKKTALLILSAITLSFGLFLEFLAKEHTLATVLFILVVGISGYEIVKKGLSSLLKKRLDMNFLMTVAAVGAFMIGHGEEGATVIFLFYVAEFLEDYAVAKTRRSVGALMKLAPESTTVKRNGEEVEVHVHAVSPGETIVVRPGERIPLDGTVRKGFSSVNQAPITGESVPVLKQVGDEVYAGTLNEGGFLEIGVTKTSDETMLSKIVKLVEKAQKEKSPTEKFVDKFAKYYTPSVMFLAMLVAVIPTVIFNAPFNEWIYRALTLLVIACPCALAISTPVSIVSGITSAARNGILIKGGTYVEEMSKMKVFAFDKTGTLTKGKPEVTDIVPISYSSPVRTQTEVVTLAATCERYSTHPLCVAIARKAKELSVAIPEPESFRYVPGQGNTARYYGDKILSGSKKLLKKNGVNLTREVEERIKKLESQGKTITLVAKNDRVMGIIATADTIKEHAIETVSRLKEMGLKVVMISGDNEETTKVIAEQLGIDKYFAELSPEEKLTIVDELRKNRKHVAMVGDGVNDAPALAKANVGIAMGVMGSDVALETADVALMHDDLSKLPYLVDLSKKTVKVMKGNILSSILIKGSLAILAVLGLVTLWFAVGVGDMGLSLAVTLNAMGLSFVKAKRDKSCKK